MATFWQKLHKKPEAYRRNVALSITIVFAALVFSFWAMTFSSRYGVTPDGASASVGATDAASSFFSPFRQISDGIGKAYDGLKSSLSNIGESF